MRNFLLLTSLAMCFVLWGDRVRLNVRVADDLDRSISNAVVTVSTQKRLVFGYGTRPDHFRHTVARTDGTGMARISFDCLTADFECLVESPGYYSFANRHGRFPARDDGLVGMVFESVETNMVVTLNRKMNPIPMYTYMNFDARKLPSDNGTWGFDLCKGDWVSPWGTGLVSDFKLEYHKKVADSEYTAVGCILFDQPRSGFYVRKLKDFQRMKSDYVADTNACFLTVKNFSFKSTLGSNPKVEWNKLLAEDEYLVMRTRVKLDGAGHVVSANYSKMYGPVVFKGQFGFGQTTFNPNVNDPNLESDPLKNLNMRTRGAGLP